MRPESIIKRLPIRFFKYVRKSTNCWFWIGGIAPNGYGHTSFKNKSTSAHRLSWFIHNGEIPKGLFVCHSCDVRNCVNPSHLWLGTNKENSLDMARKSRAASGEQNGNNRGLKEKDVREIRRLYKIGNGQYLAYKFGVGQSTILRIKDRLIWKHV